MRSTAWTISPDLVSAVTDSVVDEVRAWQSRPLESTYAIVFFDALRVKIRDEGLVSEQGRLFGDRSAMFRAQRDPGTVD